MTSLYQLSSEYADAAQVLADLDLDAQTVADTLEGISGALEVKAQNVAMFVRNLEASAAAIKEAEAQMAARRKAIEARAESVREYLRSNMERAGISKIDCPWFSLAIKQNPPKVVIDGEVPDEYMRTPEPPPPSPDKKLIADKLKVGEEIGFAHLERTTRLEIK